MTIHYLYGHLLSVQYVYGHYLKRYNLPLEIFLYSLDLYYLAYVSSECTHLIHWSDSIYTLYPLHSVSAEDRCIKRINGEVRIDWIRGGVYTPYCVYAESGALDTPWHLIPPQIKLETSYQL